MCGIAGVVGIAEWAEQGCIDRMTDLMSYRGPDGRGTMIFPDDAVAFGHRRLSIIDPNPSGAQPMVSADGRYWIIFNGEIYNYREIRAELEALGVGFRSRSDTEVLLAGYAVWGERCLERLVGMFAFAIWDTEEKRLFAARDRLGVKPFYFARRREGIVFASEVKAVLAAGGSYSCDALLIDAYMSYGFVPGAHTMTTGVERLLPGHCLTWRAGHLAIRQYWDFDFSAVQDRGAVAHAAEVERLLRNSIDLRLRSDVPLGVFLSGGLDSSTVVSLLAPGAASGLKTFSVAYDFGAAYDETPYARTVAEAFSTDHHEIVVTPREFMEFIPSFVWHMDEPVAEAAAISLYHVSRLAREHVVVCLSGEGSDEIFAGYDFYAYNLLIEKARSLAGAGVLQGAARAGRLLGVSTKFQKYLDLASLPLEKRYKGISSYEERNKKRLYRDDYASAVAGGEPRVSRFVSDLFKKTEGWDPLSRMLYLDTKTWLVDDLLIKADRMSMSTSIELRVPFLDHRLVEYAASVPSHYKMRGRDPKYILKEVVKGRLPESIVRRKKMGFPAPLALMFRGELLGYARDTLLGGSPRISQYFRKEAVEQLLAEHGSGRCDNHREIWQLIVLEEWLKK